MIEKDTQELHGEESSPPIHLVPKLDLIPHTVFLFCGPTCSGKSQLAEDIIRLAGVNMMSYKIVSSDAIRRQILMESSLSPMAVGIGGNFKKYSPAAQTVSRQAFQRLEAEYLTAISFPICSEIVVVDTTGADENFRSFIQKHGQANGYRVILVTFDYKNRSDYFPENPTDEVKDIITNSVIRFRRKILPNLKAQGFDARLRIKAKGGFGWGLSRKDSWWFEDSVNVWEEEALSEASSSKLVVRDKCRDLDSSLFAFPNTEAPVFAVIGDSHECVEELETLLALTKSKYPNVQFIHVGDYLDKGGDTEKMVNLMHARLKGGDRVVIGNHENYVFKRLKGLVTPDPTLEASYFTSVPVLEKDPKLAQKFFEIFEQSIPFAVLCDFDNSGGNPVFVTHAPCENRTLGKVHDWALLAQRNYRTKDRKKDVFDEFDWLFKEAEGNHPLHIFGHIAYGLPANQKPRMAFKNKVFLDTGAVYGGHLSAVVVSRGKILDSLHVPSKRRAEGDLGSFLPGGPRRTVKFDILDYDLDPKDIRLLNSVMANDIKYISGTMAPAPSTDTELESLNAALNWFKRNGAETVCIQPKYMGSRDQLYLFDNQPEKTFMVSRNGWKIRRIEGLDELAFVQFHLDLYNKFRSLTSKFGDVILDGELMPWAALGKGLIETHFNPYRELIQNELEVLGEDEGLSLLPEFRASLDIESRKGDLTKFSEALATYSGNTPPDFKGFAVLWTSKGGEDAERAKGNFEGFSLLHQGLTPLFVDLREGSDPTFEDANKYFELLTGGKEKMEGVVVKPLTGSCDVPYIKVRSREYLRIVYGYDYTRPERYSRLCRQKNISHKVRTSVAEHKLAQAMLVSEGDAKKELVVKMIGQIKSELSLDPRL